MCQEYNNSPVGGNPQLKMSTNSEGTNIDKWGCYILFTNIYKISKTSYHRRRHPQVIEYLQENPCCYVQQKQHQNKG